MRTQPLEGAPGKPQKGFREQPPQSWTLYANVEVSFTLLCSGPQPSASFHIKFVSLLLLLIISQQLAVILL